KRHYVKRLILG
ncbi:bacterial regulatory s, tetR family protein, partial [Vibrio parahaemolyticus VPTS-2010_2]